MSRPKPIKVTGTIELRSASVQPINPELASFVTSIPYSLGRLPWAVVTPIAEIALRSASCEDSFVTIEMLSAFSRTAATEPRPIPTHCAQRL